MLRIRWWILRIILAHPARANDVVDDDNAIESFPLMSFRRWSISYFGVQLSCYPVQAQDAANKDYTLLIISAFVSHLSVYVLLWAKYPPYLQSIFL